jgi:hypothetical protein
MNSMSPIPAVDVARLKDGRILCVGDLSTTETIRRTGLPVSAVALT